MLVFNITLIFLPHHVGLHDQSVGNGPLCINSLGTIQEFERLGAQVHQFHEIERVYYFEAEISHSFEILCRAFKPLSETFPLVPSNLFCLIAVWDVLG